MEEAIASHWAFFYGFGGARQVGVVVVGVGKVYWEKFEIQYCNVVKVERLPIKPISPRVLRKDIFLGSYGRILDPTRLCYGFSMRWMT